MTSFRDEELLADVIARLIGDVRHVAVGNASPIPATAALLARERGNGRPYVSLLQSRKHNFFTDGGRELFDCAGQGRIDVFFLSGGQIDGQGNVNLVNIGEYDRPKVRFAGSFGSAYLYYVVPKVILFRTEHSRRTLVPKVDFVSAPGTSDGNVFRTGGPIGLVTNRCAFTFADGRFTLASVHPGHTQEEVVENTGFEFDKPRSVPETPAPTPETLKLMREVIAFGGRIVVRKFDTPRDLAALAEPVLVNCTGLGSATLFDDRELVPVKGQLVVLVPQAEVTYTAAGMMPRGDGIVLGHVSQRGNASLDVDEAARDRVLNNAIAFFGAMKREAV